MAMLFSLTNLHGWQLVIVLTVILALFGRKRLPGLMREIRREIADFLRGGQKR